MYNYAKCAIHGVINAIKLYGRFRRIAFTTSGRFRRIASTTYGMFRHIAFTTYDMFRRIAFAPYRRYNVGQPKYSIYNYWSA